MVNNTSICKIVSVVSFFHFMGVHPDVGFGIFFAVLMLLSVIGIGVFGYRERESNPDC